MTVTKNHIAAALVKAQQTMLVPNKSAINPQFKSKYATLQDILDAVMPALNAAGICMIQTEHRTEDNRHLIETVLIHGESGESFSTHTPVVVDASRINSQSYMAACTYARKGGISNLCCVAGEIDEDGNDGAKNPPVEKPATITKAQSIELSRLCGLADMLPTVLCEKMGIQSFEELEASKLAAVVHRLNQIIDKKHDDSVKQEAAVGDDSLGGFDGEEK